MLQVKDFPLDHIGLAVRDLDRTTDRFSQLGDIKIIGEEELPSQQVIVRFIQQGDHKIELLQSTSVTSPVARFLEKRGEGIHHLAFRVKNIHQEMQRLRDSGLEILQDQPIVGAMNKWVFFIHPRSMGGTLIEICQPVNRAE